MTDVAFAPVPREIGVVISQTRPSMCNSVMYSQEMPVTGVQYRLLPSASSTTVEKFDSTTGLTSCAGVPLRRAA
jgi:hypothetical protein